MKQRLEVKLLSAVVGAEVTGVDLLEPVSDETIAEIRKVWLEHGVIFFRNQPLTSDAFQAFAQRFGDIVEYPFVKGLPDHPLIVPVLKMPHERHNFGGVWHTDTTYLAVPPAATMLIARELPPVGGDTLFASGYAAYEALSEGLKKTLSQLIAVNSSAKAAVTHSREDRMANAPAAMAKKELNSEHPVLRTHPETGRLSLYVNPGHTLKFAGWSEEESQGLLDYLFEHQIRPEFTCRFVWQTDSIALWDNRCVLHNPINDYHGHKRLLHRITLAGQKPV